MPLVYDELRRIAASYLSRERPGQTLQATALVNEAFVRLSKEKAQHFNNRTHFRAIAAIGMRQILIERARRHKRLKRGGGPARVTLDEGMLRSQPTDVDIEALDQALTKLAGVDPHLAHLVELRYFGGLSIEETAEALGSSPATVKRHWALARAWLKRALEG
jgi:RNA polymerase sigma factor (TIGR02999 family)